MCNAVILHVNGLLSSAVNVLPHGREMNVILHQQQDEYLLIMAAA